MYESLNKQLKQKYPQAFIQNTGDSWNKQTNFKLDCGNIVLYKKDKREEQSGNTTEYLYITYTDKLNTANAKSSFVSDDL